LSFIKEERKKLGYTQQDLAEKAGLSLRTIQRVESGESAPKGYTLTKLAEIFEVSTSALLEKFLPLERIEPSDKLALKFINLSVLAFFIIPFGNIFMTILMWRRKRTSVLVDKMGRRIINFQIIWSLILSVSLCVAPFIDFQSTIPLIFIVLITACIINLFTVIRTAHHIQKEEFDFLDLPIKLL